MTFVNFLIVGLGSRCLNNNIRAFFKVTDVTAFVQLLEVFAWLTMVVASNAKAEPNLASRKLSKATAKIALLTTTQNYR